MIRVERCTVQTGQLEYTHCPSRLYHVNERCTKLESVGADMATVLYTLSTTIAEASEPRVRAGFISTHWRRLGFKSPWAP